MATDKIMERVAALLRIAEHPNTPGPEAETALRQANSLMTKHAIDEAILRQSQSVGDRRAIQKAEIVLGGGEFRPYLRTIFEAAAETFRVSVAFQGFRASRGDAYDTKAFLYGASEDVAWLDMLYNMIKLQFLSKLDPRWDNSIGYDANVYTFKVAGFKWKDIDLIAQQHGHDSRESTSPNRWTGEQEPNGFFHKLKAAYVRHAKAIDDDTRVKTQSHQAYRLSFAESFRETLTERLWHMQRDNEAAADTIPGAALALRDVKEDADRAMWADFPDMDPEEIARRIAAYKAQQEAERAQREAMLAAMTPAQRQKFLEEEEAKARADAKRQRAWDKKHTRYFTYDATARQQGASAAASVDLTRKAGHTGQGATRGAIG